MAEFVRVYRSGIINAPLASVWSTIQNFNDLPKWTGVVASSSLENNRQDNSIGCVRVVNLLNPHPTDSRPIREELISYNVRTHSFTYKIVDGPIPFEYFKEYYATVTLFEVTDTNQTFLEWKSEFYAPQGTGEKYEQFAGAVYMKGINSLKTMFP